MEMDNIIFNGKFQRFEFFLFTFFGAGKKARD